MTEKDLRIITIILCCCLAAILLAAIVLGSLGLLDEDKESVDFSQLTYVALGDSITYGYDISRGGFAMDNPYPAVVGQTLNLKAAINYGISGSTVSAGVGRAEMCARYAEMIDDADIVSVMGGVNDFSVGVPLGKITDTDTTTFYGALNALASGLRDKYPDAFIFFMTPLKFRGCEGVMSNGGTLDDFRNAVKRVCKKYGIAVLDAAELADYSKDYDSANYTGDGLHPSQEFVNETLAPVIVKFIRDNYKAN